MKQIFLTLLACAATTLAASAQGYKIVAERDTTIKAVCSGITLGSRKVHHIAYEYPSKDADGQEVTISGIIQVPGNVYDGTDPCDGVILYNHYTHGALCETPSVAGEEMANGLMASPLEPNYILVMSDYIGFGASAQRPQAPFCGDVNARNSLDGLVAARELMSDRLIPQGKYLFNIGYSQGGTEAMFVARLRDMEYKDKGISFDKTFAGGGPLDLDKMYTETVNAGRTGNAAGLVILLASLNENCHLGLDYAQLFREPLASNVKKWVLDKRYTTQKINKLIGQNCLHHILQPDYLDLGSDACEALRGKMKELSLTDGWEPDSAQNYFIQHSRHDTYVPIQSVRGIFAWMKQKGFRPSIVPGKTSLQTNTVTIKPDHRASAGVWLMQTAAALQIWPVLYYENEQNRYFHEVVCDLNLMKVLRFLESKGIDLRRVVKAMQGAKKAGAPSFSDVLNEVSEQLKIINLTLTDLQEMLDDAGITSDDLVEVYNYLTTDPNAARSITPDGNMESIADLLLYYEQTLAAWLLQAGIDVGYEE